MFLKTVDHSIVLTGPEFQGTFFRPEAMAQLEKRLPEVLRDAARMRLYASSRKIGRPGLVVEHALDLWFGEVREDEATGGTAVTARVPTLGEAAPKLFDQGVLWEDGLRKEDTVFDLLGDVVVDVREEDRDSSRYDEPMLRRLNRVLKDGPEAVRFESPRYRHNGPVIVDEAVAEAAERLAASTPPNTRTRVAGKLEAVFFDSRAFRLILANGMPLRGVWAPEDPEPLRQLWGRQVLMEGQVHFKPTGAPLALQAEAIRLAVDQDSLWATVPQPRQPAGDAKPTLLHPDRHSLAAVWGILVEGVSDEQFFRELEALS